MSAKKYRKKPVEISAAKWDGTAEQATHLIEWMLQTESPQTTTVMQKPAQERTKST